MLEYMHVKNLALIKDCEIQFSEGLNILTGETGAGKSVLLGAVGLALGGKADKDIIRRGESEASVELVFSVSPSVKAKLKELDLQDEDSSVFIYRKITENKTIFKINGEAVPARLVKELSGTLLDIHGQSEHQSLLSTLKQRDMLDAFGGDELKSLLWETAEKASSCNALKKSLDECLLKGEGRERKISLLKYEIDEITNANLSIGEDDILEGEYKRMQSSEKLLEYTNEAMEYVSGTSEEDAGSLVSRAIALMKKALSIDESAGELLENLTAAEAMLGDFSLAASRYTEGLEFSEEDFNKTEERLDLINGLKLKFGQSIPDILKYCDERTKELKELEELDETIEQLKSEISACGLEYKKAAEKLTGARKNAGEKLKGLLSKELLNLNFLDARVDISFDTDTDLISAKGQDSIEFMISVNPGEPIKPMRNVASGGELSRIMLALKTILASQDEVDSLIFDEIDAGISGKTAWEVSGRLSRLAGRHQVIAITHLPQIAAASDAHFLIEKSVNDGVTSTNIFRLSKDGEIKELARLLGADSLNEAALSNARDLKNKAKERKTLDE